MKKFQIFILILAVIGLFGFADYFYNLPGGIPTPKPSLPAVQQQEEPAKAVIAPDLTKQLLVELGSESAYKIEKRSRSAELFEIFDFSQKANISIYKNILVANRQDRPPVYVYEIHNPKGQSSLTYLNIKLTMIDQLGSAAGINETDGFGLNSLFYNDEANPSTGFLLSEAEDAVFGFRYSKDQQEAFDFVKSLVNNYMSQTK